MAQVQEYVVRVPKETKKKYNVMRFSNALNVDVTKWKSAKLERENNLKEFKIEDDAPKFGAGSEFGKDLREEARRKKYGHAARKYNPDDQPWILRVGGKSGKKFKGIREGGVSENTSFYVFFQAPDGAFEAFPISEWYNFTPIQRYKAFSAEEAEEKFEKRDKILNYFSLMMSKKKQEADGEVATGSEKKMKGKLKGEFKVTEADDWNSNSDLSGDDDDDLDDEKPKIKKGKMKGKGKQKKSTKKKKGSDDDDDSEPQEESDEGDFDQLEVDYMSSNSSEDENEDEKTNKDQLKGVEDEDALRQLVLSDDEEEPETDKPEEKQPEDKKVTEEDKVKVKQEKSEDLSSDSSASESDDSDLDESKFNSAMFMQKKAGKAKNGSDHSAGSSRANTPSVDTTVKDEDIDVKPSNKRKLSGDSTSINKKFKNTDSTSDGSGITEQAVKRYLMRKPMTTTELLQKFKSKKASMTSPELVNTIAQILKKLNPEKQTIKNKLYLSIRPS